MLSVIHPVKIAVLGLRSFPNVQGGVESHAENLYKRLVRMGCDIHIIARSTYFNKNNGSIWEGVKFHSIWSPKFKSMEALAHTFIGLIYAAVFIRPDLLHIHAIGPAFWTPLARILGLRVVVTHHGPDYDREKWGRGAKLFLRLGEKFGAKFSNRCIVISTVIQDILMHKYNVKSSLIKNGVELPDLHSNRIFPIASWGIEAGKYILFVGRMVPEKRHLDLIKAFNVANVGDWKLVIVGASDHPDIYTQNVLNEIARYPNVISTGIQVGEDLKTLYLNAGGFVLPSSHEGLPIVLLEALSYGLPVVASDIPANISVGLPEHQYFQLGNIEILSRKLQWLTQESISLEDKVKRQEWVGERYDWDQIAVSTFTLYQDLIYKD